MIPEISAAIRSISGALDLSKRLVEVTQKGENVEVVNMAIDIKVELAEAKSILANLTIENAELKLENFELRQKLQELENQQSETLIFKDGLYYTESEDVPFCVGCYDNNKKVIRVNPMSPMMAQIGKYECPVCKTVYQ
ncbi:MAG: hypothetical protein J7647_16320 [Cyanobacteria bacterium SBLK]|nr:hypothetical protein [Cyanobacteria bacterium SBLK]